MNDPRNDIIEKIYEIYKTRGFVKEDEIFAFVDEADLSIFDTNKLTDNLLSRGVIIRNDTSPRNSANDDEFDMSKIDYNTLFNRIIEKNPELKTFIKYVRNIQPPQSKEWVSLISQVKNGNKWAYNRLFEMNLRVVIKTALYFFDTYQIALVDAIQDGCIGLMYAIDKFDPSEHNSFPGYITRPISAYIQRYSDFAPSPIFYFPAHYQDNLYKIFKLVDNHVCAMCFCGNKTDCDFLIAEVAEKLECSYLEAMDYLTFFAEYDRKIYNIEDTDSESQFDLVAQTDMKKVVQEVLSELDQRELEVLRMRIGVEDNSERIQESFDNSPYKSFEQRSFSGMSLEEVGEVYGLTRERVRQIEQKALNKLKHPTRARRLRSLLGDIPNPAPTIIESSPPAEEATPKVSIAKTRGRPKKDAFIVQTDMMDKGWKTTTLKRLKVLHDKGLPAAEIADKLGKTKNAVIGKLNRLGWNSKIDI